MFVCNVSLSKSKLFKIMIYLLITFVIICIIFGIYSITTKSQKCFVNDGEIKNSNSIEVTDENYATILKDCHENMKPYLGKTIKFSGFVYRLYDFNENQFVLGREMIISQISETQAQSVVIGFLCEFNEASKYTDRTWVEIEGIIEKGFYHSEIPIIKVTKVDVIGDGEKVSPSPIISVPKLFNYRLNYSFI